jgi:hypothetical protein
MHIFFLKSANIVEISDCNNDSRLSFCQFFLQKNYVLNMKSVCCIGRFQEVTLHRNLCQRLATSNCSSLFVCRYQRWVGLGLKPNFFIYLVKPDSMPYLRTACLVTIFKPKKAQVQSMKPNPDPIPKKSGPTHL